MVEQMIWVSLTIVVDNKSYLWTNLWTEKSADARIEVNQPLDVEVRRRVHPF